jgi:5-methylcytosine-specific restriction endonuclease McrA
MTDEGYPCSTCQVSQALDEFRPSNHDRIRQGRRFQCKACRRAYRAQNRDRINAKKNLDYAVNHAQRRIQANARRAKNPDRFIAQGRSFYQAHKEEINAQHMDRLRNNTLYREAVNARQRLNYAKRMAKLIKQGAKALKQYRKKNNVAARAWRKANPGKELNKVERRRARKLAAPLITLSAAQWLEIQVAYKHRCVYCGKRCKGRLTQDHISPVGPEGPHTLHNIVPACTSCNSKKGRKAPLCPVQPLLITIAPEDTRHKIS